MALPLYLAMIAAEMQAISVPPPKCAYMACHFSPYGTGLSNLPRQLPKGSLLILNDRSSWWCPAPRLIADQLSHCMEALECRGLLLDFQRPDVPEEAELAAMLSDVLPFPVGVSESYAADLSCSVFLPPLPLGLSLSDYLAPWTGRGIWLDLALSREEITVTEEGSTVFPCPCSADTAGFLRDAGLHCHYHVAVEEHTARFTLCRTREDLTSLLTEAADLGVTTALGLWQEMHNG